MDSNNQLQNQMSNNEEFAQMLSSCITHDDGYLISSNGGSSNMRGASINISHSNANVPHQDSQFMQRESLETGIKDTSLLADVNSSSSGVSYMPGNGSNNINIVASNCGIISSTVRDNNIPTQQQQTFQPRQIPSTWNGRQGSDQPTYSSQMIIHAQHTLATPFLNYKNPRIEMIPHLQQSPHHQPNLLRNQQWNQAPLSVIPSLQNHSMLFQAPNQMPEDSLKQLAPNATVSGSMCLRQLKYFIHEQQNRPQDNNIEFWRKFVEKYYSPMAKKRCCLSMTPLKDIDHTKCWTCDLCGTNAAKGFEISYEFLPNMSQFYFERCVENELLYLDSPIEILLPSGSMMLTFSNAIQHSIYENFRVAHQGKLCIVFTKDLKISSWEFCVQSHEKLVSHDFLSTQANELVEIAKNIKRNRELNEAIGLQAYNQVTNCNRLMAVGETLADKLELPYINEAGFSKAYFRHMMICHVFDSMKDLIGMCADNPSNNFSPIEAMKNFRESILKKQTESTSHSHMPQTPSGGGNNILASNLHSHLPQPPSGGGNNILALNLHSHMPQTPSGGGNNILASNLHSHLPQPPSGGGNNILASNLHSHLPQTPSGGGNNILASNLHSHLPQPPSGGGNNILASNLHSHLPQTPSGGGNNILASNLHSHLPQPPSGGGNNILASNLHSHLPQTPSGGGNNILASNLHSHLPQPPSGGGNNILASNLHSHLPQPPSGGGNNILASNLHSHLPQPPSGGGNNILASNLHSHMPQTPSSGGGNNILASNLHSHMPQTPSSGGGNNILASNLHSHMPQTPSSGGGNNILASNLHSHMPQTPSSGGGNNILASNLHSHLPQTPSGGGNNILAAANITNRRPSSSKPPLPVPSPLSYQHNLVTTQDPRMTHHQTPNIRPSSYPVPNQPLFSTVSGGSSSHQQQGPTVNHQINDLLARINNTDGTTSAALSKGKGIDYSSGGTGSRSYARAFAGNSLTIREPLPSDGAASGFGHHQVEKK